MPLVTFALMWALIAPRTAPAILQASGQCLHDANTETQEQHARRVRALGLARTINSAEAAYSAKAGAQFYGDIGQLVTYDYVKQAPASGQWVEGFDLHLDVLDKAYWFEVVDKTDPCGFRFVSNQSGLILTAEPIR